MDYNKSKELQINPRESPHVTRHSQTNPPYIFFSYILMVGDVLCDCLIDLIFLSMNIRVRIYRLTENVLISFINIIENLI